jgi:hypothetical protein
VERGRPLEVLHSKMKTQRNPHSYLFERREHVRPISFSKILGISFLSIAVEHENVHS